MGGGGVYSEYGLCGPQGRQSACPVRTLTGRVAVILTELTIVHRTLPFPCPVPGELGSVSGRDVTPLWATY